MVPRLQHRWVILIGTIQGVLQTLPFIEEWLEEATPSSYFVTPLAHAQLNMVGFVIMALSTMMIFLLPRFWVNRLLSREAVEHALTVMAIGISSTYVVYFLIGVLEDIQIHNGLSPEQARSAVFGEWGRYAVLVVAQAILGFGYVLLFRHVSSVIGRDVVREYWRTFRARMAQSIRNSSSIASACFPNLDWAGTFSRFAFSCNGVRVPWPWLVL